MGAEPRSIVEERHQRMDLWAALCWSLILSTTCNFTKDRVCHLGLCLKKAINHQPKGNPPLSNSSAAFKRHLSTPPFPLLQWWKDPWSYKKRCLKLSHWECIMGDSVWILVTLSGVKTEFYELYDFKLFRYHAIEIDRNKITGLGSFKVHRKCKRFLLFEIFSVSWLWKWKHKAEGVVENGRKTLCFPCYFLSLPVQSWICEWFWLDDYL